MRDKIRNIRKGIKRYVDEKVEACKEILSSAQNRLILGLIFAGVGTGLIASAYISVNK